jgi:hypothetical protein
MKYKIGDKIIFKEPLMGVECKDGTIVKEVFGKNDITKITNVDYKCYCVDNFGSTIKVKHKDLECVTEIYKDGSQGLNYKEGDKVRVRKDLREGEYYGRYRIFCNGDMAKRAGTVVTIEHINSIIPKYTIKEDSWDWVDEMFEGLAVDKPKAPSVVKRINYKHNILNGVLNSDGSVDGEKLIKELGENQVFVMTDRPKRPTKSASTPASTDCCKKVEDSEEAKAKGSHYEKAAMQPLEVMQRVMTKEQFKGFLFGNFLKYRMRSEFKGQHESDEYKAKQYAYWLEMVNDGHVINPTKDKVPYDYKYSII